MSAQDGGGNSRFTDFYESPNAATNVKHIVAVVSGKGGVGKTMVTSLLASTMQRLGYKTGILDADITGPSVPRAFGITEKAGGDALGLNPAISETGVKIMSTNMLLENETDAVVWRSPIITSTVKQFWTDVNWGDLDYLFVDLPPGTGDVPLTIFQTMPLDGIVIVTSPQALVGMIVEKAVHMASVMAIPVLGLVENMSFFECPDCGQKHEIFGESRADTIARKHHIETVVKLPINSALASATDGGNIEHQYVKEITPLTDLLAAL